MTFPDLSSVDSDESKFFRIYSKIIIKPTIF